MAPVTRERVIIDSPARRLAGELSYPDDSCSACALLLNPHPMMGGRMDNNLVEALASGLAYHGISALRFDYSGVGESEGAEIDIARSMNRFWATGHAPEDERFVEDACAANEWLCATLLTPAFLIGYSFGAHVAACVCNADTPGIAMISPTLAQHSFESLDVYPFPIHVVYSSDDFATDVDVTETWIASMGHRGTCTRFDDVNHFFRGQEHAVVKDCASWIERVTRRADP